MRFALLLCLATAACGADPTSPTTPDASSDTPAEATADAVAVADAPADAASPDVNAPEAAADVAVADVSTRDASDASSDAAADTSNPCPVGQTLCGVLGEPNACVNLQRGYVEGGYVHACGDCRNNCGVGLRCVLGMCQ